MGVCGGGTHPFQYWSDRKIFCRASKQVSALYGYPAKQFTIFGHTSMSAARRQDDVMFLLHSLNRYVPHFIALAASSPFVQRNDIAQLRPA